MPVKIIVTADFTLPLPEGWDDRSAEGRTMNPQLAITFEAHGRSLGFAPIVVQKVPLPGGSFADPTTCAETGQGLLRGGTETPGVDGTLESTAIIDGPVGKACQLRLLSHDMHTVITELHQPGNTPSTPKDVWLMTCTYAEGDGRSEAACMSALAGFRFTR